MWYTRNMSLAACTRQRRRRIRESSAFWKNLALSGLGLRLLLRSLLPREMSQLVNTSVSPFFFTIEAITVGSPEVCIRMHSRSKEELPEISISDDLRLFVDTNRTSDNPSPACGILELVEY